MDVTEIVDKMISSPYTIKMGAGKLAKWWGTTPENIKKAKKIVKQQFVSVQKKRLPKILILDIETSPLKAYVFQTQVWKAQISPDKVISEWFMLTWSAKWLFSDEVMSEKLTRKETLAEDDSRIVQRIWKLLDEADIVIAHNGDRFDVPNMNVRFVINGLKPPTPYYPIDTYKVAKRQFGFTHNSLNALAKVFGFEPKIDVSFALWEKAVNGDKKALADMEIYNRQDVILLEDVYLKLRPWIKGHPNVGLFIDSNEAICPACGSKHLTWDGHYFTHVSKFPAFKCDECGAVGRARQSVIPLEKRKGLVVSVVR